MAPDDRRSALLDAAAAIVAADGVAAVSMERIAEEAGVSRPLVYRYFPTTGDVLAELYVREMGEHDDAMRRELAGAGLLDEAVGRFIRVWLDTFGKRGRVLGPLFGADVVAARVHDETAKRNQTTVEHFSALAVAELGISLRTATAGAWMQLASLQALLSVWGRDPAHFRRSEAAATYVAMVLGGWHRLGELASAAATPRKAPTRSST